PFAAFLYALIGSALAMFIGRKLVALNFIQLRKEADFRYGLIHVRDNSESIAFYRGEEKEAAQVRHRLRDALRNLNFLIIWHRNLGFVVKGYDRFKIVVPVLIAAPMAFAGGARVGDIVFAISAFEWVINAMSVLVREFE